MVVDAANVLNPDQVDRINRLIFAVKARSGGEIVVVTMPDIRGVESADVALRIGREWKVGEAAAVGDRTRNLGVVVLVVPKETASDGRGQISILTGQGAEGFITDGTTGDIRREAIPYFQQRDYGSALELVATRLSQRFATEFGFSLDSALIDSRFAARSRPQGSGGGIPPQALLVLFIIVFLLLSASANRTTRRGCLYALTAEAMTPRRRGGSWGGGGWGGGGFGGGGGGGFGGFGGGGGFSGGGSSGSW